MDGNGRWATARGLPRSAGHQAGVDATRRLVEACVQRGIEVLTIFAFSSENWRRPKSEVNLLMDLFLRTLQREVTRLHKNAVRVRFIGDRQRFSPALQKRIAWAEDLTAKNDGMVLMIAVNYGGRWDLTQAVRNIAHEVAQQRMSAESIDESMLSRYLCGGDVPEPDLFIRTGGERRLSNYLLWQLAYTELYFTELLWPDFDVDALDTALDYYRAKQRRFGQTGAQIGDGERA
jgi:undecaprenyl diphosphate synthase